MDGEISSFDLHLGGIIIGDEINGAFTTSFAG